MAEKVIVHEVGIDTAVAVHRTVPEFDCYSKAYFEKRLKNRSLIIAGFIHGQPVGYLIGYDRFNDGSFYCWMAGVNPDFRRKGVLKALMNYQEKWAAEKGYTKIKIKTRNKLREMLAYLVAHGFNFTGVVEYPDIEDNRILLEKEL